MTHNNQQIFGWLFVSLGVLLGIVGLFYPPVMMQGKLLLSLGVIGMILVGGYWVASSRLKRIKQMSLRQQRKSNEYVATLPSIAGVTGTTEATRLQGTAYFANRGKRCHCAWSFNPFSCNGSCDADNSSFSSLSIPIVNIYCMEQYI